MNASTMLPILSAIALGLSLLEAQGQVSLIVAGDPSTQERRLAVVRDGRELGAIAVPSRVSALAEGLKSRLLHPNGHDLAVGLKGDPASFVVVFLRQEDGTYLAVDVSPVERVNLGVIGPARKYLAVETVPIEWLIRPPGDDSVQIRLQTRATDHDGRRYRPSEPLIITRAGRALWR